MPLRYELWIAENGMSPTRFLYSYATEEAARDVDLVGRVILGKNDAVLLIDTETGRRESIQSGEEWPR
ncbi:hypothetical protein [Ralstonia insidiosa]|uniref:Uncharacterized protein n=1 Tax=Ralstonia insidiosa TaxID=190721 RepID=A0A848NQA5_9RALS|nr:hypothetical protein [Ralstonia insidiosa]NMV37261.1 hypothetical protein [Ralstonia insidiosa]